MKTLVEDNELLRARDGRSLKAFRPVGTVGTSRRAGSEEDSEAPSREHSGVGRYEITRPRAWQLRAVA
jgi:hypothetical protein